MRRQVGEPKGRADDLTPQVKRYGGEKPDTNMMPSVSRLGGGMPAAAERDDVIRKCPLFKIRNRPHIIVTATPVTGNDSFKAETQR